MLKKVLFSLLLSLLTSVIFAEAQKVYSLDRYADLYQDLERVQLESGVSPLSSTYPFTQNEIEFILSSINEYNLSKSGLEAYNRIISKLTPENKKGFNANTKIYLYSETYLQTNKDNEEWIYGYNERKPVVDFDFSMTIENIFWADISLPLQKGLDFNRYSSGAESNISLLWNFDQLDLQFPFIALSSLGGNNWSLLFGRDLLNYGVGNSGSFTISDAGSYHDFIKLSTFWDKFKYTLTFTQIDVIDIDGLTPYIEYVTVTDTDGNDVSVESDDSRNELKLFIEHSFEFRPFNSLSIALNEVNIRGGGELTLGFLNPLMIMHNLALTDKHDTVVGNSLITLSTVFTPINNLNIYGEFALDQFETPSEADRLGDSGTGEPNAYGYLFGLNYLLNFNSMSILFNAEYAYTNPHLYRSANSWSIYALTRWYHSIYNNSNDDIVEPLGYEYGPDISLIDLSLDCNFLNGNLSVFLEYIYILKGEADLTDVAERGKEAFEKETPSGDIIFSRNIVTLSVEYNFNSDFSLYTQLNTLNYQNVDNIEGEDIFDFQIILGAKYIF